MERAEFVKVATETLEQLEDALAKLEHEALDVELSGDVLTVEFRDGTQFVINAHGAARQVWMAANRSAWHFDYHPDKKTWIAGKTGDELVATVAQEVGQRLGAPLEL